MFSYYDNRHVAQEMKKAMIDQRVTQKAVAARMGLSPQGLQKLMGKKNFGFRDAQRILSAMGCELVLDFVPRKPSEEKSV